MAEMYLVEKRGLYYRPQSAGYTGLKSEAGRYPFDKAVMIVSPNGPDGPQDGMAMWLEAEAPDYSPCCAWEVKAMDKAYKQGWADAMDARLSPPHRHSGACEMIKSIWQWLFQHRKANPPRCKDGDECGADPMFNEACPCGKMYERNKHNGE